MNKRERIRQKTGERCAYCGKPLPEKGWHADHVKPAWRSRPEVSGSDDEANLVPSCARCNLWKKTLTPDEFRCEIEAQFDRLYRDSPGFRLAVDFAGCEVRKVRCVLCRDHTVGPPGMTFILSQIDSAGKGGNPLMDKGLVDDDNVELYDMVEDSFFTLSADYFNSQSTQIVLLDKIQQITNTENYESNHDMFLRADKQYGLREDTKNE